MNSWRYEGPEALPSGYPCRAGEYLRLHRRHDFEGFRSDDKTASAAIRKFEIIGEATKQLPEDFRRRHPDIPWKEMAGMRDRLIHFYFGVDHRLVWHMPRMNGWETLTALRRLAPGLPVILASGYGPEQVLAGPHPDRPQAFLGKPYRLQDLRDAINQALVNRK